MRIPITLLPLIGFVSATVIKRETDPCTALSQKNAVTTKDDFVAFLSGNATFATWADVHACYQNIPFDDTIRSQTVDTMNKAFDAFFAYVEEMRNDPVQGLDYVKTDVGNVFNELLSRNYDKDFDFHRDVRNILSGMNDGHTLYQTDCYNTFQWLVAPTLYLDTDTTAKTQTLRVFRDIAPPGSPNIQDCKAISLNGNDAFTVINNFAKLNASTAKDPNSRLNLVLAEPELFNGQIQQAEFGSTFFIRADIPPGPTVDYVLDCGTNGGIMNITRPWIPLLGSTIANFSDTTSYKQNVCLTSISNINPEASGSQSDLNQLEDQTNEFNNGTAANDVSDAANQNAPDDPHLPTGANGVVVYSFPAGTFLQLKSDPSVGVANIFTELITTGTALSTIETQDLVHNFTVGFYRLQDLGCTRLIIDLSANNGGAIAIGTFFNKLLFRNLYPQHDSDLRINALSSVLFKQSEQYQDAASQFSFQTFLDAHQSSLTNDALFTNADGVLAAHSGLHNVSAIVYDAEAGAKPVTDLGYVRELPSLNFNQTNMVLVTDGVCGSTCAIMAVFLKNVANVSTIAVGGILDSPMSLWAFPATQVKPFQKPNNQDDSTTLFDAMLTLNTIHHPAAPALLPYSSTLNLAFRTMKPANDDTRSVEFIFEPADKRIYWNNQTIRDPTLLYEEVRVLQWGSAVPSGVTIAPVASGTSLPSGTGTGIAGSSIPLVTTSVVQSTGSGLPVSAPASGSTLVPSAIPSAVPT